VVLGLQLSAMEAWPQVGSRGVLGCSAPWQARAAWLDVAVLKDEPYEEAREGDSSGGGIWEWVRRRAQPGVL
jgi:hypothetical protein